uniref:SCP domain-containing protein n=2 Tax=Panagrolaimus superbus TaxID=310955 RepID=A0A914YGM4_9BILA
MSSLHCGNKIWVLIVIVLSINCLLSVSAATFGCTTGQSDDYRNVALQINRQYRTLLAQGKAPNKCGQLPTAKNYYEINWDCGLETSAKVQADNCAMAYSSTPGVGEILFMASAASAKDAVKNGYMKLVNTPVTNGADPDTYSNPNNDWNRIVNYRALYVGCASTLCSGMYKTVCHYDKPAYSNQNLYERGDNCVTDADCTTIIESTCKNGLCIAPPKPDETINTQCPLNPSMNDYARDQLVKWHNYYRALVIKGNEPAAGGRKAPKGKNMYKIKYSCTIEQNAQNYANNCPYPTHSAPGTRTGWGENMAYMSGGTIGENMGKSVGLYYSELLTPGMADLVTNVVSFPGDMGAGHYTQVVWGKTYEIGCGGKLCGTYWHLVCQYNVAGNYNGTTVYEVPITGGNGGCTTDADCTTQAADTCSVSDGLCNRA